MTKPPANVLTLPLEQRAEMALKAAVEEVIVEHAQKGLPIYIWRDGKVVEVPPENCGRKRPSCKRDRLREFSRLWRQAQCPRGGRSSPFS